MHYKIGAAVREGANMKSLDLEYSAFRCDVMCAGHPDLFFKAMA